jgi:hypothetical protein
VSPLLVRECITWLMNEEKLVRKLSGEKKMEAMVQRLDRLTQNEARQTAAQILKVVHGLVENMKAVMGGEKVRQACPPPGVEYFSLQTARYRSAIFKKPSVCFSSHNQVIVYLNEHQKLCIKSQVI